MIRFNPHNGEPATFATLERPDFSSRSGLAFRSDGSLLLKSALDPAQADGVLYLVNPIDGTVATDSPAGTYGGITHNTLAFDAGALAYTIAHRSQSSVLQTIDLTTEQTTDVLNLGIASVSAITFAASNAIPEPSGFGLLIVATVTILGRRRYRVGLRT